MNKGTMYYVTGCIGKERKLLGIFGNDGIEVNAAIAKGLNREDAILFVMEEAIRDAVSRGYTEVRIE